MSNKKLNTVTPFMAPQPYQIKRIWSQLLLKDDTPKRSSTVPDLSHIMTQDYLAHRALPKLPTDHVHLNKKKRVSIVSIEDSIPLKIKLDEIVSQKQQQKMVLHCRVLQVANSMSSKNYDYTLKIKTADNPVQTDSGTMKRVAKGISAAHPRTSFSFHVEGEFQVICHIQMRSLNTNFVHRLKSMTKHVTLPQEIDGHLILESGKEPLHGFANKGITRYSLKTIPSMMVELTLSFWLELI
ncbi:hypothetical protein BDB01DRAFT_853817 [Pilobolus umbonatus]|nr:hypothetical protein BDB01DRAFT_853817 [Pilobolus umbonatus]